MDFRIYWVWLQLALGPGSPHADTLIRNLGSAQAVFSAGPDELKRFDLPYNVYKKLIDRSVSSVNGAIRILKKVYSMGGWVLTPEDRLFPPLLREIACMPLVFYGMGEMPDLNELPSFTVIGTRGLSMYGKQATAHIAGGLSLGGAVVVSGGACGGDAIAHGMTLNTGGITIALQACGIDVNYPVENNSLRRRIMETGAVLTEFFPGLSAPPHHFHIRNRILSGMTLATCVTEAPFKSGTMITAHNAFEQGREVYAVAGDMLTGRSPGTDLLINEGARLVHSAVDILEPYEYTYKGILNFQAAETAMYDPRLKITSENTLPSPPPRYPQSEPRMVKKRSPEASGTKLKVAAPVEPLAPDKPPAKADTAKCPDSATEHAKLVYASISGGERLLDNIITNTGLETRYVLAALTELEMLGCIQSLPGKCFEKI